MDPMVARRYRSSIIAEHHYRSHNTAGCGIGCVLSCPRQRRAPALDESIMQGVPGVEYPINIVAAFFYSTLEFKLVLDETT